jgi:hypothetical protein
MTISFSSRLVFVALVAGSFVYACNDGHGQGIRLDTAERRIDYAIKHFESVVSNSKTWRQGDVLWRHESHFDSFDTPIKSTDNHVNPKKLGGVVNTIFWNRFIFDYERGRYCWLSRVEIEQTNFETTGNRVDEVGYTIDKTKKKAYSRIFPQSGSEMDFSRIHAMPIGFPDLRLIGLGNTTSTPFEWREQILGNFRHAAKDAQITQSDRRITTQIESHALTVKNFDTGGTLTATNFQERCFDPHSLMPINFRMWGRRNDGGDMGGPRTDFAWTEKDGIYLPKSINSAEYTQRPIYSAPQFGWDNSNIYFHWFSINGPIDDEVFDGSVLKDSDTFRSMLDPYKSKATDLIEIVEKTKPQEDRKIGN